MLEMEEVNRSFIKFVREMEEEIGAARVFERDTRKWKTDSF